ncbi:MAG: hypothetical protein M1840_000918 [Geoglossum simile]|nr:MAG: hypothetical protein M1840_000918 [Geoglossum simile]
MRSQNTQASRATREQVMEQINCAIQSSQNRSLSDPQVRIRAIKRHPSGDLALYTECKEHTELLIQYRAEWESSAGPKARVVVPTFGVLVHGISTEVEVSNTADIENRIKRDNLSYHEAQVTYTGWLKKDVTGKRASTMVVEFDKPQHADWAIEVHPGICDTPGLCDST